MWEYNNTLCHGTKGMKWGFTKGVPNGNRHASEVQKVKERTAKERGNAQINRMKQARKAEIDRLKARDDASRFSKLSKKEQDEINELKKIVSEINFENNPPADYAPKLTRMVQNGVHGYSNDRGDFFPDSSGTSITLLSWQADVKYNKYKADVAARNAPSDFDNAIRSGKKKVDSLIKKLGK